MTSPPHRWPHLRTLWTTLVLFVLATGCGEDNPANMDIVDVRDASDLQDGDVSFMDSACPGVDDPNGDADNDGILNGTEDSNRNCQVDDDETNPTNPDTDGDGLLDGQEDIDHNGQVNNGELDPRLRDSDGDGVQDGLEATAVVCVPELLDQTVGVLSQSANAALALPGGFDTRDVVNASALVFDDNPLAFFGFVAEVRNTESLNAFHSTVIGTLADRGHKPLVLSSREFLSWGIPGELSQRAARTSQLTFEYGPNSKNPGLSNISPQRLRDEIAFALAGGEFDFDKVYSPPCALVDANLLIELNPQGETATVFGVFSCEDNLSGSNARRTLFRDLADGTSLGPASYTPSDFRCTELEVSTSSPKVDFIWVIDNSGSMADEQALVASAAQRFIDTLDSARVDWRLGVTTTEAWLLSSDPGAVDDPLLDGCSGLRGDGFVDATSQDAVATFRSYVVSDPECIPAAGINAPNGSNVCGDGRESGLQSGLEVLNRAAPDAALLCDENHRLRDGARRIVVWVSDEEDQALKFDDLFEPSSPFDPRRVMRTDELINAYAALDTVGCALVGDAGPPQGICEPLDGGAGAVDGAQYGLGYLQVAGATGGAYGSICNDDLQPIVDACTARALGAASDFVLDGVPVSHTLRVGVDDELLVRSRTRGWDYDPDVNSIVFYGVELTESSRVAVSYMTWKSRE